MGYAPTRTWRRWRRRANTSAVYSICSAPAASAPPALVMPKGHRVEGVPAPHKAEGYKKTNEAVLLLKKQKVWNDITKVCAARRVGAGQGEMRSRIQRRGACLIDNADSGIIKAFRDIPGITPLNISKLNNFETCSWRSCRTFLHLD